MNFVYCNFFYDLLGTGHIQLSGGVKITLDSDNQFTLTCISTGGPATTVTWTTYYSYSSNFIFTEGTETVLDDPVTAQYTHTLTRSWRWEGQYLCRVANHISSVSSLKLNVEGKTECELCTF